MRLRLIRRHYTKSEEEEEKPTTTTTIIQVERCEQLPSTLLQNRRGVASAAKRFIVS